MVFQPRPFLVHCEELELGIILRRHFCADCIAHTPVQHLVVDRDVLLVFLNHGPNISNGLVPLGKVSFRGKGYNFASIAASENPVLFQEPRSPERECVRKLNTYSESYVGTPQPSM